MKKILLLVLSLAASHAGAQTFSRKDVLQGGLRPERTSYDVRHYDLNVRVDLAARTLSGYNEIRFEAVEPTSRIQVDLFENMKVDSIVMDGKKLKYKREFGAVFVDFPKKLEPGAKQTLRFHYSGAPTIAKNAPWDGGFVFTFDRSGKPFVGVAVQGTGASLWFPVKDTQTDEPEEGANITVSCPDGLMGVSNGRFVKSEPDTAGYTKWKWRVVNPINNYNITLYIGDYVHFGENYHGLDLDYYVLRENEEKAKKQFEGVKPMLDCFQSKFGPYPFPEDGFKLVEAPYLGMEHQSAIAYGNRYRNGYMGNDLSGTGEGKDWDFILVHESGHEWFGNSITSKDIADMWIHEAFTCYAEAVYVECTKSKNAARTYLGGLKNNILNDRPVIGTYGVNNEGSGDMYFKGAVMLHSLRETIYNDMLWWQILYDFNATFRHKTVDTETVIAFFNERSGRDLTAIFNQYLRHTEIPTLEMRRKGNFLEYRWNAREKGFNMPVDATWNGQLIRLQPTTEWKMSRLAIGKPSDVYVHEDQYLMQVKAF